MTRWLKIDWRGFGSTSSWVMTFYEFLCSVTIVDGGLCPDMPCDKCREEAE